MLTIPNQLGVDRDAAELARGPGAAGFPRCRAVSADTVLLTAPNQFGVGCDVHLLASILADVAPESSWR